MITDRQAIPPPHIKRIVILEAFELCAGKRVLQVAR